LEDTDLLTICGASLQSLCQRNHNIGFQMMRCVAEVLSRRLTATRLQLLDLFLHDSPYLIEMTPEDS
jgi:CRP/FNR family transcriptional regulator, cyclic AMP receptor protein